MISRELLKTVVANQQLELNRSETIVKRELVSGQHLYAKKFAIIIKGVRRCGKSTMLTQLVKERKEKIFYLNLDDERLMDFKAADFQPLMEIFIELFGESKIILFDEIQNVSGWELFINRMLREGYEVYITGSNADLLSKELGTHLTGRHLDYELYPFSFREYLKLKNPELQNSIGLITKEKAALAAAFENYLVMGGMPEVLKYGKLEILGQITEDIIQKDIIRRYSIRKPNELRIVLRYLIGNAGRKITYRTIANNFGIKSDVTVQKYIGYAEETYLLFTITKYEKKLRKFDKNPKKIYCIDNGMMLRNLVSTEQPRGTLLENLVAIELKRRKGIVFYYINKNGTETDFVIVENNNPKKHVGEAIQVCLDPSDPETKKREENALLKTLEETNLRKGKIITLNNEETRVVNGKIIEYVIVWKWLLG